MATANFDECFEVFRPRPRLGSLAWSREYVCNEDGRPYDHHAYPHMGAPGGPCAAADDPAVRRLWLMFATRLAKTFLGQCLFMHWSHVAPAPAMFASASEKGATDVIARSYRMLDQDRCPLRSQLRGENERKRDAVVLKDCRWFVAWARSPMTLADKNVKYGHANEIDKWEQIGLASGTSREADPLQLFLDRFKNEPWSKIILESTPQIKGRSRVEAGLVNSTNCRLWVPCPHCERYQTLHLGDGKLVGLVWPHDAEGRSAPPVEAARAAAYLCGHCQARIENHHRPAMMRRGVWAPAGCTVDDAAAAAEALNPSPWRGWQHAGWIVGRPAYDGPDAGYQLSSLYALKLDWFEIVHRFLSCKSRPQELRNFINQWLGETWQLASRQENWQQLGTRLIDRDLRRGVVPKWARFLSAGVDRQKDRFPWVIDAWGPGMQCATIAYGEAATFDELFDLLRTDWPHADGGAPVKVAAALADSGYIPQGIAEFVVRCQRGGVNLWACKGSSTPLNCDFRVNVLGKETSTPGLRLFLVDSDRTQLWLDSQLDDGSAYRLHAGMLSEHQDFLEQLLNDAPVEGVDATNHVKQTWERISDSLPNDFRDCRRYAYAAMLAGTRGGRIAHRGATPAKVEPRPSRIRPWQVRR